MLSKLICICGLLILSSCATIKKEVIAPKKTSASLFRISWAKNLDPIYNTGNLPIALNAPIIFDGIVYCGDGKGVMHAYNLVDGRELWHAQEVGRFHNRPIIFKDAVIYGTVQGRVIARNRLTGKLIYDIFIGSSVDSTGTIDNGVLFFHLRNHQVLALDAQTGKILWSYKRSVPFITTLQGVTKPVVYQNRLYIGFADSYIVAFSKQDGTIIWEKKLGVGQKFIDVDITPTFFQGDLVTASAGGFLHFLNMRTGVTTQILSIIPSTVPLYTSQGILVGTVDGELVLVDRNKKIVTKKKISKFPISLITFWKGKILVGTTRGDLLTLQASDYSLIERKFLGSYASAIFAPPSIVKGRMALLSSRYRLYLFY